MGCGNERHSTEIKPDQVAEIATTEPTIQQDEEPEPTANPSAEYALPNTGTDMMNIAKNISATNLPTTRIMQQETEPEQNPPDEEQSHFVVTEVYYRRKAQDIAVVALENAQHHTYPLSLLEVSIGDKKYYTNILSFSESHLRIFLTKDIAENIKTGTVLECAVIRHELPINLPGQNVFVVSHGLSIALVIQLIKIYKLDKNSCEFLTLCHKQDDLVFKSSLKDLAPCKSIELLPTSSCLQNLREYFRRTIDKNQFTHVVCFGPNWLLQFVARLSQEKTMKQSKFYGLENVYGFCDDTEPITSFANLRNQKLDKCLEFDPDEAEFETVIPEFIKSWVDAPLPQENNSTDFQHKPE